MISTSHLDTLCNDATYHGHENVHADDVPRDKQDAGIYRTAAVGLKERRPLDASRLRNLIVAHKLVPALSAPEISTFNYAQSPGVTNPHVILNSRISAFGTLLKFMLPFPCGPIFVKPNRSAPKHQPEPTTKLTKSLGQRNCIDQKQNKPRGDQVSNRRQRRSRSLEQMVQLVVARNQQDNNLSGQHMPSHPPAPTETHRNQKQFLRLHKHRAVAAVPRKLQQRGDESPRRRRQRVQIPFALEVILPR